MNDSKVWDVAGVVAGNVRQVFAGRTDFDVCLDELEAIEHVLSKEAQGLGIPVADLREQVLLQLRRG